MKTIYINKKGKITDVNNHYKVTLSGYYSFNGITKEYTYDIEKVEPELKLTEITTKKILL